MSALPWPSWFVTPPRVCDATTTPLLTCCNVFDDHGHWGTTCIADQMLGSGNFSADPLFCRPLGTWIYSIHSSSPCAAAGSNGCWLVGSGPVGCGPVALESESWGRIKARYRAAGPVDPEVERLTMRSLAKHVGDAA